MAAPLWQVLQVAPGIAAGDLGSRIIMPGNIDTARLRQARQGINDRNPCSASYRA